MWGATACLIVVVCGAYVKNMILSVQLHVDSVEALVALQYAAALDFDEDLDEDEDENDWKFKGFFTVANLLIKFPIRKN